MRPFRVLTTLVFLLVWGRAATATPFFARTYNMSCQSCHSGCPRLNPFGLAFKANNFRIPGAEMTTPLAWQKTIPLATQVMPTSMRFSPGAVRADYTDTQLLAGGLLTRTTAFYVHHSLWIDDKPGEFPGYEVWVQQTLDERSKLMLKAGQFELPYIYSPYTHLVSAFQPQVFSAGLGGNETRMGSAMRGLQMTGIAADRVRWAIAYGAPSVISPGNAVGQREFFGEFHDLFLRVSNKDLAHNYGALVYFTNSPRDPADASKISRGVRYAIDGTYLWRGTQFYAMAVYGENSDPLGDGKKGVMRSAFVEADRMIFPWMGVNARYEVQTLGIGGQNLYTDAKTLGIRFYPMQGLRLTAEFQQSDHGNSATALFAAISF